MGVSNKETLLAVYKCIVNYATTCCSLFQTHPFEVAQYLGFELHTENR